MSKYVIFDVNSKEYFVRPSYWSWDLTSNIDKATFFEDANEAYERKDAINRAVSATYWDYDDIVPNAVVKKLGREAH